MLIHYYKLKFVLWSDFFCFYLMSFSVPECHPRYPSTFTHHISLASSWRLGFCLCEVWSLVLVHSHVEFQLYDIFLNWDFFWGPSSRTPMRMLEAFLCLLVCQLLLRNGESNPLRLKVVPNIVVSCMDFGSSSCCFNSTLTS